MTTAAHSDVSAAAWLAWNVFFGGDSPATADADLLHSIQANPQAWGRLVQETWNTTHRPAAC